MPAPQPAAAKPRFVGIDIVKILACFLVICIHFFLYTGFYGEPITVEFGQREIYLRWIAYCCVPLFMITTGYLMKNKTLSRKYFRGIIRVLVLYFIISIICVIYNRIHFQKTYTTWEFVTGFFNFTNAQYAWYVEYYVCMFLIIPFVNLAYNGLKKQSHRTYLVFIVFAITILSQSLFVGIDMESQAKLVPGYFLRGYPIAYYLIGAYIRDYPPKRTVANKLYLMALLVICMFWLSITTYQQSLDNIENNCVMLSWHYNDYGSWPVAVCSTVIFLLLFDITCSNKIVIKILSIISNATFAAYLISYVFDNTFYLTLCSNVLTVQERFEVQNMLPTILKIFGCAMGSGLLLQGVYTFFEWGIKKLRTPKVPAEHNVNP